MEWFSFQQRTYFSDLYDFPMTPSKIPSMQHYLETKAPQSLHGYCSQQTDCSH